ncbi:hypothetical protein A2686_02105 [Candidatus Woesebacteria bacterium RIFCSPHIGHO2_01_FULL_38_10]|uniref:DUF4145 domain-containing protein n=1 Tax=Candidatus Woesebacteria bacterium RIFCSPLOWO2_01_FULL_39_10b TaxID=1802517 RepID=A0A1F8BA03_9BACT|nr:MAG: hypothetical protein A2686_02105 [Candidatus Woesebacteria bacterium RIFCSPHIGHO2_01_FULL_38_10]OGM60770.1 MAG: hypothetical protein A2892_01875 [Candidatus Woesebacteria bacterium RIFCSPLOWO2_01_FULL_39_10b]
MNTTTNKLIERVGQLLEKGQKVAATKRNNSSEHVIAPSTVNSPLFHEWKNNSQNFISMVCGEDSPYYKNFVDGVKTAHPSDVDHGIGILTALKEDLELGYLTRVRNLVSAEIFTDFIEMAQHLLDNSYKDSAASLVGAVLENGLRQIAQKHTVDVKSGDDIGSLNTKLADKEVYSRLLQKQIQAWKAIRDSADHGKFEDYKTEDVKAMLEGVQRFLAENL